MENPLTEQPPHAASPDAPKAPDCPDCHMPRAWHFCDPLDRGYLVCPCAECAKAPGTDFVLDLQGTEAAVCAACAKLDARARNFAPERIATRDEPAILARAKASHEDARVRAERRARLAQRDGGT